MKPNVNFTVAFFKSKDGRLVGMVEEVPGALSYGRDLDELINNLKDAVMCIFEGNRRSHGVSTDYPLSGLFAEKGQRTQMTFV